MTGPTGPDTPFAVEVTGLARAQLKAITRHATYSGSAEAVVTAFREIVARLRQQPREAGDPMYRLRAIRFQVYNLAVRPLYVEYGVHDTTPLVVIRHAAALSDADIR